MSSQPASPAVHGQLERRVEWPVAFAGGIIVAAVLLAYANSFSVPFVFDDRLSVLENPTIRGISWSALAPPHGQGLTVEGRPILNLSLAFNYAISGLGVTSYHVLNVAIHLLAALTLFGLVRRTLSNLKVASPSALALLTALVWAVHPLQTESVTYIVQRTESLMGFFYLLTLYCFLRGTTAGSSCVWLMLTVASCALGMATKEVMVSAPLIVFLYDRTFITGSFRDAWRRHWRIHLSLAASWLLLGVLVLRAGNRGGTIGLSAGVTWWQYAFCQTRAVIHYLQLALWPHPLIFDYGSDFVRFGEIAPYALLDLALLVATAFALWRRPALGFLGAWFFVILAPTTSFVGGTRQMLAEHRMYLSLAAVALLMVLGVQAWFGRRSWIVLSLMTGALIVATVNRNRDYRSELVLYAVTVAERPNNVEAHYNYGKALVEAGRLDEAIAQYHEALRLRPNLLAAQFDLANALSDTGRFDEAVAWYEAALRLKPDYAMAHFNLGNVFVRLGQKREAAEHYQAAVRADGGYLAARDNLGSVLLDLGRLPDAEAQFQAVLQVNPNLAETHCNLGTVYLLEGKITEAEAAYERALSLNPRMAPAREGLARARRASP